MHDDWKRLTLATWARWTAAGKPLHFSPFGDSVAGREAFIPRDRRRYRTDAALWQDGELDIDEGVGWLMRIDSRLHGALSAPERRVLLAACAPLGRPLPAAERAQAAGVDVDELHRVRRAAMALLD